MSPRFEGEKLEPQQIGSSGLNLTPDMATGGSGVPADKDKKKAEKPQIFDSLDIMRVATLADLLREIREQKGVYKVGDKQMLSSKQVAEWVIDSVGRGQIKREFDAIKGLPDVLKIFFDKERFTTDELKKQVDEYYEWDRNRQEGKGGEKEVVSEDAEPEKENKNSGDFVKPDSLSFIDEQDEDIIGGQFNDIRNIKKRGEARKLNVVPEQDEKEVEDEKENPKDVNSTESKKETETTDTLEITGARNLTEVLERVRNKPSYDIGGGQTVSGAEVADMIIRCIQYKKNKIKKRLRMIARAVDVIHEYRKNTYSTDDLREQVQKYRESSGEIIDSPTEEKPQEQTHQVLTDEERREKLLRELETGEYEASDAEYDQDAREADEDTLKMKAAEENSQEGLPKNKEEVLEHLTKDLAAARTQRTIAHNKKNYTLRDHWNEIASSIQDEIRFIKLREQVNQVDEQKKLDYVFVDEDSDGTLNYEKNHKNDVVEDSEEEVKDWDGVRILNPEEQREQARRIFQEMQEDERQEEEPKKGGFLHKVASVIGAVSPEHDETIVSTENASDLEGVDFYKNPLTKEQGFVVEPNEYVRSTADPSKEGYVKEVKMIGDKEYVELKDGTLIPSDFVEYAERKHVTDTGQGAELPPKSVEEMMKDQEFVEFFAGDHEGPVGQLFDSFFGEMNDSERAQTKKTISEVLRHNPELMGVMYDRMNFFKQTKEERDELEEQAEKIAALQREKTDLKVLKRRLENDPIRIPLLGQIGFFDLLQKNVRNSSWGKKKWGEDTSYLDKVVESKTLSYYFLPMWAYKKRLKYKIDKLEKKELEVMGDGSIFKQRDELTVKYADVETFLSEMITSLRDTDRFDESIVSDEIDSLLANEPEDLDDVEEIEQQVEELAKQEDLPEEDQKKIAEKIRDMRRKVIKRVTRAALLESFKKLPKVIKEVGGEVRDGARLKKESRKKQTTESADLDFINASINSLSGDEVNQYASMSVKDIKDTKLFGDFEKGYKELLTQAQGDESKADVIAALREGKSSYFSGVGFEPQMRRGKIGRLLIDALIENIKQNKYAQ